MSQERERERFLELERCLERRLDGFTSSFSESLLRVSFFAVTPPPVVVIGVVVGGVGVSDAAVVTVIVGGSFLLPLIVSVRLAISLMGMIGLISFSGFVVFMLGLGGLVLGIMGVI